MINNIDASNACLFHSAALKVFTLTLFYFGILQPAILVVFRLNCGVGQIEHQPN